MSDCQLLENVSKFCVACQQGMPHIFIQATWTIRSNGQAKFLVEMHNYPSLWLGPLWIIIHTYSISNKQSRELTSSHRELLYPHSISLHLSSEFRGIASRKQSNSFTLASRVSITSLSLSFSQLWPVPVGLMTLWAGISSVRKCRRNPESVAFKELNLGVYSVIRKVFHIRTSI